MPEPNDQALAPDITLTAYGSEREIPLRRPGLVTVLTCFAQETEAGAAPIEALVRRRWPKATEVLVVDIVDLRKVPRMFRRIAESVLASEHKKAVEALATGLSAFDYVVVVADWQGEVAKAFGLDPAMALGGVVITAAGAVAGRFDADDYVGRIEGLIEEALGAPAA